jgi:deoxyribose-phosphate aldolase
MTKAADPDNTMQSAAELVAAARQAQATPALSQRALGLLDLTSLNDNDSENTIAHLCQRAQTRFGSVAAVCVHGKFVRQARAALQSTPVNVATVVNFPGGDASTDSVHKATAAAIDAGAQEIDVVLPYRDYLAGNRTSALAMLDRVRKQCNGGVLLKVILETGELGDTSIILAASREAIATGVDFLKTSTGKVQTSATLEACVPMLQAIRENTERGGHVVGLKASGGIRDATEAARYLSLAAAVMGEAWISSRTFRFGASSLIDSLLLSINRQTADSTAPIASDDASVDTY